MATQFEIDCADMAGSGYRSNRPYPVNKFPVPAGWNQVVGSYVNNKLSGFEAVSFTGSFGFLVQEKRDNIQ